MQAADIQKARTLSKQLASFGAPKKGPVKAKYKPRDPEFLRKLILKPRKSPIQVVEKKIYTGEPGKKGDRGEKGDKPIAGIDFPMPKNGKDAVSPTVGEFAVMIKEIAADLTKKETIREELPITQDLVRQIVQMMHQLPETDKLEVSKGIRNATSFIYGGTKYQTSELMHGGGSSTSGSSLTAETPVGAINDSNVTFTVTHQPLYLVVNGSQYTVGTGTYQSYVAGTITLTSAVGIGGFLTSFYNA